MKALLRKIEVLAPNIRTFWFEPERRLRYEAGQYLDLHLPHETPDNRGATRTMSLSTSPTEPLLGITTTFETDKGSTFKRAMLSLKPGDIVTMTDPMGDFVLPKSPTIPIVFVAGGLGITPVRSMVKWLIDTGGEHKAQLVYITRRPTDMLYLPLLNSYKNLQLAPVHTGDIRPATSELLKLIGSANGKLIYLSGAQPMMESYWQELQDHGIPRDQLVLDYFTGYNSL